MAEPTPSLPRPGVQRCHGRPRRLVIMVKQPVAGRVKTRLARDIGTTAATRFYRHTLSNVVSRMARDPRWQTMLSIAPAAAIGARSWPCGVRRIAQSDGDLGQRMQAIFEIGGPGPIVIIGTDIPAAAPAHIAEAFRLLGNHDVVFGPATDGGFWLVGMRRSPKLLAAFRSVRWSSLETLGDCLAGLGASRVAMAAMQSDVDAAADLVQLGPLIGRRLLPAIARRLEFVLNPTEKSET